MTDIKIDITDWDDEYMEEEPNLSTKEDALDEHLKKGYHPAKMARMYIASRERGQADAEMLPGNKVLLMTGGASAFAQMRAQEFKTVKLKNGKDVEVRAVLGTVPEPDDDIDDKLQMSFDNGHKTYKIPDPQDDYPILWNDDRAIERAELYLDRKVPGYVYGRLKIIAANGGDVWKAANSIINRIEEMAKNLT